jgi:uncharacterized protein GlcG (DUF336 family)
MRELVLSIVAATGFTAPAIAAEDGAFVTFQEVNPEVALQMAQAAMTACRNEGYQIGVTGVDRFGIPQVFLRDRLAGKHVNETSQRKTWTAVSFRTGISELAESTKAGSASSGIRNLATGLPLGEGLIIYQSEGSTVAGIGVQGAPEPRLDNISAQAGIDATDEQISL